jgi:hypothetical protein
MTANRTVVARNGEIVGEEPDHQTEVSGPGGKPVNIEHLVLHLDEIQQEPQEQEERQTGEVTRKPSGNEPG